jgi:hypothetical protein
MENLSSNQHGGYAAFHVNRSSTVDPVLHLFPGKWGIKPMGFLTRWDNVYMSREQYRFATTTPFSPAG